MIAKLSESELIAQKECRTNLFIAQQGCCTSCYKGSCTTLFIAQQGCCTSCYKGSCTTLFIAQQGCYTSYSNVRRSITNGLPPFDQKPMM